MPIGNPGYRTFGIKYNDSKYDKLDQASWEMGKDFRKVLDQLRARENVLFGPLEELVRKKATKGFNYILDLKEHNVVFGINKAQIKEVMRAVEEEFPTYTVIQTIDPSHNLGNYLLIEPIIF
jgi:hypothetical protein